MRIETAPLPSNDPARRPAIYIPSSAEKVYV
jgi:hypothetical protein